MQDLKEKLISNFETDFNNLFFDCTDKYNFDDILNSFYEEIITKTKDKSIDEMELLLSSLKEKRRKKRNNLIINTNKKKLVQNEAINLFNEYKNNVNILTKYKIDKNNNIEDLAKLFEQDIYEKLDVWKKNPKSYYKDFRYFRQVMSTTLCVKSFKEDMLLFSYLYLSDDSLNEIFIIPSIISSLPKSIDSRAKNVKTITTTNSLIEFKSPSFAEYKKKQKTIIMTTNIKKTSQIEKEIKKGYTLATNKVFSNNHIEIIGYLCNFIDLNTEIPEEITFSLSDAIKKFYKADNSKNRQQFLKDLEFIRDLTIKSYDKETADLLFSINFLSFLVITKDDISGTIVVKTALSPNLKKQLYLGKAIKLQESIKIQLVDNMAKLLSLHIQTFRLKHYYGQIKDEIFLNIDWFKNITISSYKRPSTLLKRAEKGFKEMKEKCILIKNYKVEETGIRIWIKPISEKEYSLLNYSDSSKQILLETLDSNLY